MTTLATVSGIQARIFTLPNRSPFMIAADLAEVYGTSAKALNQAVSRNPERFPEDFAFYLTEAEEDQMWSQIVTTSLKKRDDFRLRAYTHAGAYALSAVLKTPIAAIVSVTIHRAFAAMEAAALADANAMLVKLRIEAMKRSPIRVQAIEGARQGMDFETIWRQGNPSRWKVAGALREVHALGLIERLPSGMPALILPVVTPENDPRQMGLFSHV